MPNIKQIEGGPQAGTLNINTRLPSLSGEVGKSQAGARVLASGLMSASQALGQTAEQLARMEAALEAQRRAALAKLQKSEEDTQIQEYLRIGKLSLDKLATQDLAILEPDPSKREAKFEEESRKDLERIVKDIQNPRVRAEFTQGILPYQTGKQLDVRRDSGKEWSSTLVRRGDQLADSLANEAATLPPYMWPSYIGAHMLHVDGLRANDHLSLPEAEKRIAEFPMHIQKKQMKVLLNTNDFTTLRERARQELYNAVPPDDREKILSDANTKERVQDEHRLKLAERVREEAFQTAIAITLGGVGYSELGLTEIEQGLRPPLRPSDGAAIRRSQESRPATEQDWVEAMSIRYNLTGRISTPTVNAFVKEANDMFAEHSASMTPKMREKFQQFTRRLASDSDTARRTNAAEVTAAIAQYRRDIEAARPALPPRVGAILKPFEKKQQAEDEGEISRDPSKVTDVTKKRIDQIRKESGQAPTPETDAQDILRGLGR